jgi:hypothetical protein
LRVPLLRSLALHGGMALLSLIVGVAIAELAVRAIRPQQLIIPRPDIYVAAESLGWKHRPLVATTINTGERTVSFFTDSSGFRVGKRKKGRDDAGKRVLIVGDSFMAAMQVEYEQSVAGLLDSALNIAPHSVEVLNTAVGGWDPPQYLIQTRRIVRSARIDLALVFVFLGNDIVDRAPGSIPPRTPVEVHKFRLPRGFSRGELVEAFLYPVNDGLERRSHLFVLAKERLRVTLMRAGLTAAYRPTEVFRSEALSPRWDTTAAVLREIAEAAAVEAVPALFVLVPSSFQVDSAELRNYIRGFRIDPATVDVDQPNRLLASRLGGAGLSLFDPLPAMRSAAARGERLYGSVDPHFSPRGHEVVWELIMPLVSQHLVLAEGGARDANLRAD